MRFRLVTLLLLTFPTLPVLAQKDFLIEVDTGRKEGVFTKSPVYQRAILSLPEKPTDTALLFFRGSPGIARIMSVGDKNRNLIPFLRSNQQMLLNAGIALVVMDCPTDEWGVDSHTPTACLDSYRSSKRHAEDVRGVIAKLKTERGISRFYIMGHSFGSLSSRWLAKNLGNEIAGSIHSASMNVPNKHGHASSIPGFDYRTITAPQVHVHHANDACRSTPYSIVKGYAGENLISVYGGEPEGDTCEGKHLHSYRGRETGVVQAIVKWIKSGQIENKVGE
jgi:hypothetical protein